VRSEELLNVGNAEHDTVLPGGCQAFAVSEPREMSAKRGSGQKRPIAIGIQY